MLDEGEVGLPQKNHKNCYHLLNVSDASDIEKRKDFVCIISFHLLTIPTCDEQTVVQHSQGHMAQMAALRLKEDSDWKRVPENTTQLCPN